MSDMTCATCANYKPVEEPAKPAVRQGACGPMVFDPCADHEGYIPLLNVKVGKEVFALYWNSKGWAEAVMVDGLCRLYWWAQNAALGIIEFHPPSMRPDVKTALTIAHGAAGAAGLWKECPDELKRIPRFPLPRDIAGALYCGQHPDDMSLWVKNGIPYYSSSLGFLHRDGSQNSYETLRRARVLGYPMSDPERDGKLAEVKRLRDRADAIERELEVTDV